MLVHVSVLGVNATKLSGIEANEVKRKSMPNWIGPFYVLSRPSMRGWHILGTVDLVALSGDNWFTASLKEHDALTELVEQSQRRRPLAEERAAERRPADATRRR